MKKSKSTLIITLFSIFFTAVFYKQMIGLNLFLYNAALLTLLAGVYKVFDFKNKLHIAVFAGTALTAIATLLHASYLAITANIFSMILLFGIINSRDIRMLANTVIAAIAQFFSATIYFFRNENPSEKKRSKWKTIWRWVGIVLLPLIVLIVFFMLYSASSSKFNSIFGFIGTFIANIFDYIFYNLNFSLFFLFCFGFIISCAYFVVTRPVVTFPESKTDKLLRTKQFRYSGRKKGLLTEFRVGIIMFSLLNLLLLIFNTIDIWYVWLNFEWDGELLKEFVHEGTYVLITTLVISIILVLIFFRKNLNFFSKNKPLKILANIWLAQNMIMTISVLIRNLHYISYYNLAYLRIGVLLFIALAFFGLLTVFIKVNSVKNFFYLFRVNMLFAYLAFVAFSLVDWDVVIAKFNFNRSEKAFVHFDFLATLDDKALPYIDKPEAELQKIEQGSVYKIIAEKGCFMDASEYVETIEKRKTQFLAEYQTRSVLEWNYADYRAYKKLADCK